MSQIMIDLYRFIDTYILGWLELADKQSLNIATYS